MTRAELIEFLRKHRYAVEASVTPAGAPQAAVVGIAVDEEGCLAFDTMASSRKALNLRRDPRAAFVVWSEEQTVQLEGLAEEPTGEALARLKRTYFAAFPEGAAREAWPSITWFRVRPTWARYSDFREQPRVEEIAL